MAFFTHKSNQAKNKKRSLNSIRREIQNQHLILIIVITILFSFGGSLIAINSFDASFNQHQQGITELFVHMYNLIKHKDNASLISYLDEVHKTIPEVDVISIVKNDLTRTYHTNHALINTHYDGTVPDFNLHKKGFYTENAVGPSGPQRRTYGALYDAEGNYAGFVIIVRLKTSIMLVTVRTVLLFVLVTLVAIFIEVLLCKTISSRIKNMLLGYEPDTITSMFIIRDDILASIYDGIIAVDKNGKVQFANNAARAMLNNSNCASVQSRVLEQTAQEQDASSHTKNLAQEQRFADEILRHTLLTGQKELGLQEETDSGRGLLIDCMPLIENGLNNGAVAILHDRTEYTRLMEELSGTKYLVDSMRANNHDFTNKLHVILGLIQIGEYEHAISYIQNISLIQKETIHTIMSAIDNPTFAALLIGKIARSSECNVNFVLEKNLLYKRSHIDIPSNALVTIVGNLIDNALDALLQKGTQNERENGSRQNGTQPARENAQIARAESENEQNATQTERGESEKSQKLELSFGVTTTKGKCTITVKDSGIGMDENTKAHIFDKGFSTKGDGRGIGLFDTKKIVEQLDGTINVQSSKNAGTTFVVTICKEDLHAK